jgi:hypothetical protein
MILKQAMEQKQAEDERALSAFQTMSQNPSPA